MATALALAITGAARAQQADLDAAIRSVAGTLADSVDRGARIAVLSMDSGSDAMANYLVNEMIAAFVGLQGERAFTVVDRAQLDLLAAELHFGLTGYVDDATAQAIGRIMGVQAIVTGAFEPLAGFFRLRAQLIQVETAAILAVQTADVRNDALVQFMMGGAQMAMNGIAAGNMLAGDRFNHFTAGERWGTWAANFVPGLGSFVIMGDTLGGVLQLATGGLGWILVFGGLAAEDAGADGGTVDLMITAGAIGVLAQQIFNGIRSATFMRNAPEPRRAVAGSAPSWNIALMPGSGGIEGVSLIHTRRF